MPRGLRHERQQKTTASRWPSAARATGKEGVLDRSMPLGYSVTESQAVLVRSPSPKGRTPSASGRSPLCVGNRFGDPACDVGPARRERAAKAGNQSRAATSR
jgi:hypothetical protein